MSRRALLLQPWLKTPLAIVPAACRAHRPAMAVCHAVTPPFTATRGAKRKTKMSVSDLPQGPLAALSTPMLPEEPVYPTVIAQVRANMKRFNTCVVLTRVGGFYEVRH